MRRPREHLARRLEGRIDLAAQLGQVERERLGPGLLPGEELVGVQAVGPFGRDAAGRRMRVREQAARFELGELVADGRGGDAEPAALDERP